MKYLFFLFPFLFCFCSPSSPENEFAKMNECTIIRDSLGYYIPFDLEDGRIVIKTKINNVVEAKLMVDNGCHEIFLTKAFMDKYADTLNLQHYSHIKAIEEFTSPSIKITVAKGYVQCYFGDSIFENNNISAYEIPKKEVIDKFVLVVEETDRKGRFPNVDGIFPLRLFAKRGITTINFEKKRIEFSDIPDSTANAYSYRFGDAFGRIQVIDMFISFGCKQTLGQKFSVLPDLGYTGGAIFLNPTKKGNKLKEPLRKIASTVEYVQGKDVKPIFLSQIQIEDLLVKNCSFLETSIGALNDPLSAAYSDMMIGTDILSVYNLSFDYGRKIIYMKPYKSEIDLRDDSSILSGLLLTMTGSLVDTNGSIDYFLQYYVFAIIKDFCVVDFKLGDKILKVGEQNVVNVSYDSLRSIRRNSNISQGVTVLRGRDTLVLYQNKK